MYSFYRNHTDRREREDFLKNYHGEYSGYHGGNDNVTYQPGKGVHFSHGSITEPYAKVELKWNAVEKRVSAMIAQGRFYPRMTGPLCRSMKTPACPEHPHFL